MKNNIFKYKNEMFLFILVIITYLIITIAFFSKTTIFYDLNNTYDVLLDTDTGVLFNLNVFAINQDNSKHVLFSAIISIFAYPIYLLCTSIANPGTTDFNTAYGFGLICLQIVTSAISITLVFNHIKKIKMQRLTLILLTMIMIFSFPQLFMTLNVERFIYSQFTLIFFIFIANKMNGKNSYLVELAAIPLFGITISNIYLYLLNIIFEFKLKIGKILKHLITFILMAYICVVSTKSYESFMNLGNVIQYDTKFISGEPILEKVAMIIERLLYSVFYFPGAEIKKGLFLQNGEVATIPVILTLLAFCFCVLAVIENSEKRVPKLCMGIILFNLVLHGIIGYNLTNSSIMTINFSFAVIVLLAYFTKALRKNEKSMYNIFLSLLLVTIIISNINGFIEILNIGIKSYPV
ncbi:MULTISPECIES: DUF6080 domain-containing protein [unclassified Clostridioides]|uniref:DUF6080 domain-containing protein n=1 Tax=unclassified Clostridioides TaxID=2635829 RepID=UPI001D0C8AEC